jgi:hypothetical protein
MTKLLFLVLVLISSSCYAQVVNSDGSLPDPILTPGVISTSSWTDICTRSLSKNRNVSAKTKEEVYRKYGMTSHHDKWCNRTFTSGTDEGKFAGCEVDHLLPLEDGGSNDIKSLWPQPYASDKKDPNLIWNARMKDKLETRLHKLICKIKISDDEVKLLQLKIINNWIDLYKEQYLE